MKSSQYARRLRRNLQRDFTESLFTLAADATDTADAAVDATERAVATAVTASAVAQTTTTRVDAAAKVVAAVINRI